MENLKNINRLTDEAILAELGARMSRCRLDLQLTQAQLAQQAGISKRTLERLESGDSTQLSTFIRVLRVLELLPVLGSLLPEPGPRPMDLLRLRGKERKRASTPKRKKTKDQGSDWTWGDEQ